MHKSLSKETPEAATPFWSMLFKVGFGTFAACFGFIAYILIIVWLKKEDLGGGLGPRDPSEGVTATYFNWHPFLMSTAFLLLMTPAAVSFELYPFARYVNKNIHLILMTLATMSAFAGLAIILDCHNNLSDTGSFLTPHSFAGLITLIFVGLNFLGGLGLYGLKIGGVYRAELKPLHKRAGLCGIVLGLATVAIGVQEKTDKSSLEGTALHYSNAIEFFVYLTLVCVIFTVAKFVDKSDANPVGFAPIGQNQAVPQKSGTVGAAAAGGQYSSLESNANATSLQPYQN